MQFMKNTNIKRAAIDVIREGHQTAVKHLSSRRYDYSDALLIDWFMQSYKQIVRSEPPNVDGQKLDDILRFFLTQITSALVMRKLKYDPPETENEFKLISDEISNNMHLFINFRQYLN